MLAQLKRSPHPNIVGVLDLFEEPGEDLGRADSLWCMVLEFVEGMPGQEHLGQRVAAGALGEADAVAYVQQIGKALKHLHGLPKQIVHRDVKPSNVVVRQSDNQAILIDFGLAREFLPYLSKTYTQGGTPSYGAPEQFAPQTRVLGEYMDVYGLAATLFHLVTGQAPVPGFVRELSLLRGQGDLLELPEQLSEPVREAIRRGMAVEIGARSQTMAEWLGLLAECGGAEVEATGEPKLQTKPTVRVAGVQPQAGFQEAQELEELAIPQPDPLVQGLRNMGRGVKNFVKEVLREEEGTPPQRSRSPRVSQQPQQSQPQKWVLQVKPVRGGARVPLELLPIRGGTFWMGQTEAETRQLKRELGDNYQKWQLDRELPRHRVTVPPFWIGRYPVTQAQYKAVMGKNPTEGKAWVYDGKEWKPNQQIPAKFLGEDKPVVGVSWEDAVAFCQNLTEQCREELRGGKIVLPTEAQWEYACRAGTETAFYFGDRLEPHQANFDGNYTYNGSKKGEYRAVTTAVGSFPANAWGLQDMHGNVWEWCWDEYHESYAGKPEALKQDGSIAWSSDSNVLGDDRLGQNRVLRGGSWYLDAGYCRSALRLRWPRGYSNFSRGFRVLLSSRTS
ncbi:MAG: SUMF1/EgtB/PvdO family nonheme iron enzyme [Prochlorothrix sp.]